MKIVILISLVCTLQLWCGLNQPTNQSQDEKPSLQSIDILTDDDVVQGAENMHEYLPMLAHKRVALVVNSTSVVHDRMLHDTLITLGIDVVKIFTPEHGLDGQADAGQHIGHSTTTEHAIPILSLYGSNKKPTSQQLKDVDVVVFDMQDVGVRFYTYLSTMHYVMEACAESRIPLIVLDRPNPHGFYIDGPILQPQYKSFVGMHEIPIVHGMTLGELSLLIKGEGYIHLSEQLELTVIPVRGWNRRSTFDLPIAPSPNLPNHQAIMLYPSLCLFEATDYSIGRGTIAQFQVIGKPNSSFGDFYFTPRSMVGATHPKHENELCKGWDLRQYPLDSFYEKPSIMLSLFIDVVRSDKTAIDRPDFLAKLVGNKEFIDQVNSKLSADDIRSTWSADLKQFEVLRDRYALYH